MKTYSKYVEDLDETYIFIYDTLEVLNEKTFVNVNISLAEVSGYYVLIELISEVQMYQLNPTSSVLDKFLKYQPNGKLFWDQINNFTFRLILRNLDSHLGLIRETKSLLNKAFHVTQ